MMTEADALDRLMALPDDHQENFMLDTIPSTSDVDPAVRAEAVRQSTKFTKGSATRLDQKHRSPEAAQVIFHGLATLDSRYAGLG